RRVIARAAVAQRLTGVHVVTARLKNTGKVVAAKLGLRIVRVVQAGRRHVDVYAPEQVDNLLEALEVDDHVVVDVDAQSLADDVLCQRGGSAVVLLHFADFEDRIYAVLVGRFSGLAGDVDHHVAGDAEAPRGVRGRVDRHDEHRVGAAVFRKFGRTA